MKKLLVSLLLFLTSPVLTEAHSVWIEPGKDGQLIIRFAEPDGKFEKSPGHLDELELPVAWKSGEKPQRFEVQKKSDHFLIVGSKATDSVQVETRFMVMAAPRKPGRLPYFYARWAPRLSEAKPALLLDIVPTTKPGEAKVLLRGKPIPGVNATFRTPDEKEVSLTANEDGVIQFSSAQSGQHMLSVAHQREHLAGFAGGLAYDLTSHNAALTWIEL